MCLTTVNKTIRGFSKGGIGYKLVKCRLNSWSSPMYCSSLSHPYNTWIKDDMDEQVEAENGKEYDCGFHIFLNRQDVADWANLMGYDIMTKSIVKVRFRNVVAVGQHEAGHSKTGRCVIAREMKVYRPRKQRAK